MSDILTIVVTTVLSGSIFAAAASLVTSRALARKTAAEARGLDARLPAEIDSVVVQGAEQAVLTMGKALEAAEARIRRLEGERDTSDQKIRDLEAKVEQLRRKVAAAERALALATEATTALQRELAEFVEQQRERG